MKPVPGLPIEQQPDNVVLAMLLCGEARGEGIDGMNAVAQSIMNRLKRPLHFGATIKDICLKPWQYSCFNANDPNRAKMLDFWHTDPASYAMAEQVVVAATAGALADTVGPATHYVTDAIWNHDDSDHIAAGHPPRWYSKQCLESGITKETAHIGHQHFAVTP